MKRMTDKNINTPEAYSKIFRQAIIDHGGFEITSENVERLERLLKYFEGGKFLDMGCLNSPLCIMAQRKCPNSEIVLLDFAPDVIKYFEKNYPYKIVLSDCRNTPFEDNEFDYVVAGELIEHLEKPEELIKEMARILKPNGTFALSTPSKESDNSCGGGYHIWSFSKEDIEYLLKSYGKPEVGLLKRKEGGYFIIAFLEKY